MSIEARPGLRWMDRQECVELLATDTIGRLAVIDGGTPTILPVS